MHLPDVGVDILSQAAAVLVQLLCLPASPLSHQHLTQRYICPAICTAAPSVKQDPWTDYLNALRLQDRSALHSTCILGGSDMGLTEGSNMCPRPHETMMVSHPTCSCSDGCDGSDLGGASNLYLWEPGLDTS